MNEFIFVTIVLALLGLLARMTNKRYEKHEDRIEELEHDNKENLKTFVQKTDYDKFQERIEAHLVRIEAKIDDLNRTS